MAVYYQPRQQPSQQHNQDQNQKHKIQEAKRPPLVRFIAWVVNKTASTVFEKPVKFLLGESLFGRLIAVIIVSLIVGAITDLTITSLPITSVTHTASVYIYTPIILGILAGLGNGGFGGFILGGLWGWFISQILDAAIGELISQQIEPFFTPAITWSIATLCGLLVGKLAEYSFIKNNRDAGLGALVLLILYIILSMVIAMGIFYIIVLPLRDFLN